MADAKKTLRITQVKSSVGRKADQGQPRRDRVSAKGGTHNGS